MITALCKLLPCDKQKDARRTGEKNMSPTTKETAKRELTLNELDQAK